MDAAASLKVDADIDDVYALFLKIENTEFPTAYKQRSTVIKYTKLPEFDFKSNRSWPQNNYTLQPRLRRIITLDEPLTNTSRSLKTINPLARNRAMAASLNKRKIVTISEHDEYNLHPKFSKDSRKSNSLTSNRSNLTELEKESKAISHRTTSRLTTSAKYSKETKTGANTNTVFDKKETYSKSSPKKRNENNQLSIENKSRHSKEKDFVKNVKSVALSKTSLSKKSVVPSESNKEISVIKAKLCENLKSMSSKKYTDKPRMRKRIVSPEKTKTSMLIEMQNKNKPLPVIYVPIEEKNNKRDVIEETELSSSMAKPTIVVYTKSDECMDTKMIVHKDVDTETEPMPSTENRLTDMEGFESDVLYKCVESDTQTDLIEETYDKLEIPDVSLIKDKSELKEKLQVLDLQSKSLPNLKIPTVNIVNNRNDKSFLDARFCKSTSYIISRSTLTYRTKQKINVHVVGNNDNTYSNQSPSLLAYPMNVVSVFKGEMSSNDISNNISLGETHESKSSKEYKNCLNEIKSLDCSYVPNSDKLMKPSDIISTIRVNNGLLHSVYMCEQFQRELNFIDSFFESLQYLENCTLSHKCLQNDKYEELVNNPASVDSKLAIKNSEYDNFLLKLENGTNYDDSETMASKNIFLLNILIRDEQRRAKNLLYVLKRREDALKDFTKSQILYLENKKKQDNTDISALKKKQRGALLKLQHECGEMQRMRKALLTLSEKRKLALMKTKKDLELKLKNNVDVEQIINGKKKLKRNPSLDRTSVPLKCFDLSSSSSGCDDSISSQHTCENTSTYSTSPVVPEPNTSEKSIQTGDSILETTFVSRSTDTAAENFVVVDGGYLNILFHNLSLPQIFSGGKQYEVNEEAIKNIIDSTTSLHTNNWCDIVEKLLDQVTSGDIDKSSTPSTARSLVEEFEQHYKTLADCDHSSEEEELSRRLSKICETKDAVVQIPPENIPLCDIQSEPSTCTMVPEIIESIESDVIIQPVIDSSDHEDLNLEDASDVPVICPNGPLPVPPGAADGDIVTTSEIASSDLPKTSDNSISGASSVSSQFACDLASSVSSFTGRAHVEAAELHRQQLAIEREIKELEQQQFRLLAVREIPDKPPPPYTPRTESRPTKLPHMFQPIETTNNNIWNYVVDPTAPPSDPTNAFDVLVKDFCDDTLTGQKLEQGDKPWDAYNLLPQKPVMDTEKLVDTISSDLVEVLTPAKPVAMTGVSSRRSDHIDDVLFAEWQRIEPEWTSLQSDEAAVKSQLFETIFQKILTETVDEYKRTVLSPIPEEMSV